MYVVAALYKFTALPDFKTLREPLKHFCGEQGIFGTLLLAHEGINGTVAGSREAVDALRAYLARDARFDDLEYKESTAQKMPFKRMKVRLKKEIVTLGVADVDPTQVAGVYVTPQEWNQLLKRQDLIVIDTRNDYEVEKGTFKGAINPQTKSFGQLPQFVDEKLADCKDKPVAMFCTGGIRCEKATAYLKSRGFQEVYHLKGGILKYLEEIPEHESLWQGTCFVFDERVALGHSLIEMS